MVKKQEQKQIKVKLPLEWYEPEELISRYANNMVVQHTPNEFIVSFFETRPPLVLGDPVEQTKQLETIKSVRSLCVSRIIIAPDLIDGFIKALQINYQNYLNEKAKE
jgi:hypothetical protein